MSNMKNIKNNGLCKINVINGVIIVTMPDGEWIPAVHKITIEQESQNLTYANIKIVVMLDDTYNQSL